MDLKIQSWIFPKTRELRCIPRFLYFDVVFHSVPSTPVGLEKQSIPDGNFDSSSVLNATTSPHLARLNELRDSRAWCSSGATASEWLQVSLGKQYTLTHIALQGVGGGYDVTALTVKYEKTQEGENWITYSKLVDDSETSKVMFPCYVCSVHFSSSYVMCLVVNCRLSSLVLNFRPQITRNLKHYIDPSSPDA